MVKPILYFAGGLVGGYILCKIMLNRTSSPIKTNQLPEGAQTVSEFLGANGRPARMNKRIYYKWSGAGKAYTHTKRGNNDWNEAYIMGGHLFTITGNTDTYNGENYSETTLTQSINGNPIPIWILSSSLIQVQ